MDFDKSNIDELSIESSDKKIIHLKDQKFNDYGHYGIPMNEKKERNPTDIYIFKSQYPYFITIYSINFDGKRQFCMSLSPFGKIEITKKELGYQDDDFLIIENNKGQVISKSFQLLENLRYIQIGKKNKQKIYCV